MEIIDKKNKELLKEYESFAKNSEYGNFMQSLRWPKVKENWGWDAVISRGADGKIRGTCLVIIKHIPIFPTTFLYAPHGPVCDWSDKEVMTDLFEGIKVLAKKYKAYQFMWDPPFEEKERDRSKLITDMGFSHIDDAPELTTIQARNNYMLRNIKGKTADEVMQSFKPDWRNRIRKGPKKGVYCEICGTEALDDFYPMMEATGIRDGFSIRGKDYFVKFIEGLGKDHCHLFMCYVDEDGKKIPLSGAVTTQYAGKTCYVYGASANHHRNLYPNYLMQWTMINWALEGNCEIYDFMGIPFYKDETNPNYGVYKFKKGFNGEVVTYAGEYFYTFRPIMKKIVDFAEKVYMDMHERKRQKLLKNRNTDMQ
ncbi:peptidoglycan bridge formation glycyltransferase FemA/FemB family protein [uncultured Ruminococcus sp.]|uniref:lipid II:glycine glycyltransferase FemX n=1 Tax=uncultured Ruminococcus sp. TaxID=165186 RepID=UPI0025F4FFCD|nr:peptidoglycan bridge formation glycyltransferase FemA/FemB family protein [uncultured Ruminococcus sp.]